MVLMIALWAWAREYPSANIRITFLDIIYDPDTPAAPSKTHVPGWRRVLNRKPAATTSPPRWRR